MSLDNQNIAGAANDYYRMLEEDQGLRPDVPDLSDKHGRLRLRANTDVNLINENTGRPNKLTTIASHKGGRDLVRKHLGFSKWTPEMSKAAEAALLKYNQELGEATESLDTGGATEAVNSAQNIIAVLVREGYTSRDIIGMCKALERSRGEHTNNLAKLSELDKDIAEKRSELEKATDETTKNKIAESLRNLQDVRAALLEAASAVYVKPCIGFCSRRSLPERAGPKKQPQSLGRILAKLAGKAAAALPGIIGSIVSWLLSFLGKTAVLLSSNL